MTVKYKHFHKDELWSPRTASMVLDDLTDYYAEHTWNRVDAVPTETSGGAKSEYIDLKMDDPIEQMLYDWAAHLGTVIWGFDLDGWQQPLRLCHYLQGDYHDWHIDHVDTDQSKLAFSILLNPASRFTGGQAQFMESDPVDLRQGEAFVFPAYHPHRVTPVLTGERYVLLGWLSGPRFK